MTNLPKDWGWVFLKLYKALYMVRECCWWAGGWKWKSIAFVLVLAVLLLALHCCCEKGWKPTLLEDYTVCPTQFYWKQCCRTLLGVFSVKTIHCVHYWEVACEFKWKKFIFTPIFSHLFWFLNLAQLNYQNKTSTIPEEHFLVISSFFLAVSNSFWLNVD